MGVKVRIKRRKLYLDIYQNGKRTWEALYLTISDDPAVNRENMRLAEYARAKREQQIFLEQQALKEEIITVKPLPELKNEDGRTISWKKPNDEECF